ncbi:MAG: HAD family hydrolase [Synechococcus sp. NAT40]|nr:HAD family hydrolase [Synechococcus sp. NAT40]
MSNRPLLVFDFDGVIVDGMEEYWWSACLACLRLSAADGIRHQVPNRVPDGFRQLRPWIHHGWEMVLMASLLQERDGLLQRIGVDAFVAAYSEHCRQALEARDWSPQQLQEALEHVRHSAMAEDRSTWLNRHRPFAGVPQRLRSLASEGVDWAVLTTKGRAFTAELLDAFDLQPALLFGHEAGSKPDVLLRLIAEQSLCGFVEDRLATLETVLATPGLRSLPCFLAEWGYLRPSDRHALPQGVQLLELTQFAAPLADWT